MGYILQIAVIVAVHSSRRTEIPLLDLAQLPVPCDLFLGGRYFNPLNLLE